MYFIVRIIIAWCGNERIKSYDTKEIKENGNHKNQPHICDVPQNDFFLCFLLKKKITRGQKGQAPSREVSL